jgi:hypothetical protein
MSNAFTLLPRAFASSNPFSYNSTQSGVNWSVCPTSTHSNFTLRLSLDSELRTDGIYLPCSHTHIFRKSSIHRAPKHDRIARIRITCDHRTNFIDTCHSSSECYLLCIKFLHGLEIRVQLFRHCGTQPLCTCIAFSVCTALYTEITLDQRLRI